MINQYNLELKCKENNIQTTDYLSEYYDDIPENKIKLHNRINFSSMNPNKTYFELNTVEENNVVCIPLGVMLESLKNIPTVSSFEKSILCSCQISNYTRTNYDLEKIMNLPFVKYFPKQSNEEYLQNLANSKYVLSPHGERPDCYRHWESMYVSAIPITLNHPKLNPFKDLPILFLDSWDELSEELLNERYSEILNKSREKLDINYWIELMKVIR